MSDTIIQVNNLSFYYGPQKTINDLSFDFKEHKNTCIIGASGSGKSTLLRVLNKIYAIYPSHKATGEVIYNGSNILRGHINMRELRTQIGMVFQRPTPFPMSIYQNIAFGLKAHYKLKKSECDDRVEQALRQAALWDEVKKSLYKAGTHLSGGQQQRLCFARTLAILPRILLLDEPTSSLDPLSTKDIEYLIEDLKQKYTIIMVTHKLRQAKKLADEVIFMSKGKIVESNTPKLLFEHPQNDLTKVYIENE